MTTPHTLTGKMVVIVYGFFGCSSCLLFFNLFLERIITFLAYLLKSVHELRVRRRASKNGVIPTSTIDRRGSTHSTVDDEEDLTDWKPPVYWVMFILFVSATFIACCASAVYSFQENWTYAEALYFCFVAFATIGFGDYVVDQNSDYDNKYLYRFGNFVFLVVGCCCVYSLFNVTSIVIKQFLNFLIKKLNRRCCCGGRAGTRPQGQQRRNAITPVAQVRRGSRRLSPFASASTAAVGDATPPVGGRLSAGSDGGGSRRGSNEVAMKDLLRVSKISMMMMQKQLAESAQRGATRSHHDTSSGGGFEGGVGPLAILSHKFSQDD